MVSGLAVLIVWSFGLNLVSSTSSKKPNIVIILADDLGWNDVSFHGSNQIPTPNIDALAYNGIILNSHYVPALCTPSRSALMTGKYPTHTAMTEGIRLTGNGKVVTRILAGYTKCDFTSLIPTVKLMPEFLKEAGYSTHAVGKWHLGFFRKEYTPTYRGFDSHYGYWNGYQDYYDHSMLATHKSDEFYHVTTDASSYVLVEGILKAFYSTNFECYCLSTIDLSSSLKSTVLSQLVPYKGYDMRRDLDLDYSNQGRYSTDLFTDEAVRLIQTHDSRRPMFLYLSHLAPHAGNEDDPFQAPDEEVAKFPHIDDPERRVYAAMVSRLDQSVGEVVTALRTKGMLDNSIIVFMSDNGAPTFGVHSNRGSNWPLRGMKESPWEGGVRGVAAVWSPLLAKTQRVSNQMMHMSDWLPTLYSAAGLDTSRLGQIDGIDMWKSLSEGTPSARTEIVHNIDEIEDYDTIRRGDWKYIRGSTQSGQVDGWYGESGIDSPSYNADRVLSSRTGITLAGMITKLQIKEKESSRRTTQENESSFSDSGKGPWQLLTSSTIRSLRQQAEVRCDLPTNGSVPCNPRSHACLFNIREDPCETTNLASQRPAVLNSLKDTLERYRGTTVRPLNVPGEARANPALWNDTWVSWGDEEDEWESWTAPRPSRGRIPLLLSLVGLLLAAVTVNLLLASNNSRQYGTVLQQLIFSGKITSSQQDKGSSKAEKVANTTEQ
uniref:Sulfatase N-terminal domain-containing protein n=1 Tax=Timema bartmani TaxID=61472 RepID=A0A7R9HW20_9NEOP|nr:unnamed protein product [Timema bartmani]